MPQAYKCTTTILKATPKTLYNAIEKLPLALHAATSSTNAILQVTHYTVTQIATVSAVHYFSNVFHERKTFMMLF